ncbi:hypothetical protein SS50377_20508 [Spironucleus salmonicida]|uniref:Uncharacterized protein n=1 Tax=Spironucleus salmonicida TaxID=348837 RepID=V6LJB7_9EUKA|nr:hypothetical protein SS50377_20508 [Spironucleus salmonicida]|eukprot:EST43801.1 Hypothetical protein SS50377_ja016 [Spironucleus salmonicida]
MLPTRTSALPPQQHSLQSQLLIQYFAKIKFSTPNPKNPPSDFALTRRQSFHPTFSRILLCPKRRFRGVRAFLGVSGPKSPPKSSKIIKIERRNGPKYYAKQVQKQQKITQNERKLTQMNSKTSIKNQKLNEKFLKQVQNRLKTRIFTDTISSILQR